MELSNIDGQRELGWLFGKEIRIHLVRTELLRNARGECLDSRVTPEGQPRKVVRVGSLGAAVPCMQATPVCWMDPHRNTIAELSLKPFF